MPVLNEITLFWQQHGVGIINKQIFGSSKAEVPDGDGPYLNLSEYGSFDSQKTHDNRATERPTLQAVSRAADYPTARALLQLAYNALGGPDGLHNVTLGTTFYLKLAPRGTIFDLLLDDKNRARCAFNIETEKERS